MFACANCWLFHPSPQHNGKFCQGPGRLHQLCNTKPCQPNGVDFRAQQCAEYNSKPFRGWYYKWKPYTKVEGMGDIWALMHSLRTKANVSLTVGREHSKPLLWVQNFHASSFTGRARHTFFFFFKIFLKKSFWKKSLSHLFKQKYSKTVILLNITFKIAAITPVLSVTWFFRNNSNMLIWWSRNISYYHPCWKQLRCFIFLWKRWHMFVHDSFMNWTAFIWNTLTV